MSHLRLVPRPNPTPGEELRDPELAGEQRRIYCCHTMDCLSFAEQQKWRAMSCLACNVDEPIDATEYRSDLHGMAELWRAVVGGRRDKRGRRKTIAARVP